MYGVYAANNCSKPKSKGIVSIKSITDFFNPSKNDAHQNYASFTRVTFAYKFLTEKVYRIIYLHITDIPIGIDN